MNSLVEVQNLIYEIRGHKVMIDSDLAKLYGVQTFNLNKAVKRNIQRFPADFMFQLTKEEFMNWRSHFVISKTDLKGLRRPPYAFTEEGVAMLASVLRTSIASEISVIIMRAFVMMK